MLRGINIGSCFSEGIFESLESKIPCELSINKMHTRTDVLNQILTGKDEDFLSRDTLTKLLENSGVDTVKNQRRILEQSLERVQNLKVLLRRSDFLLIDFNYDLGRAAYKTTYHSKSYGPYIFNMPSLDVVDWEYTGFLSEEDILANIVENIKILQIINPQLNIFLLNYPKSGFEKIGAKKRIQRTIKLSDLINKSDLKAHVVPLIDIKEELLSEKGGYYFEKEVYEAYATYIANVIENKSSDISILDAIKA
jgi:hypothetical protein